MVLLHCRGTFLCVGTNTRRAVLERQQGCSVTRMIDPSDLLDAGEVAALLGLSRRQAVATYRQRYETFPEPVVVKNSGHCTLWARADIEAWAAATGRTIR